MIQNLKIDIIYYDTPSDFEFEFNLGGCCHSRVLNNKTSSAKEMIGCLSKAVSRSRVILVIGKLGGADGLFSLISKAISIPLTEVSAEEYGIVSGTDTTVIANSLPLVSTDGLLAGCIIESGPQSIILLPSEKSLRKDIAENLVFQYITAVSRTPDTETVVTPDSTEEDSIDLKEENVPMVETETIEENSATNIEDEVQGDIFINEPQQAVIETNDEPIIEAEADITVNEEQIEEEEKIIDIYEEPSEKSKSPDIDDNYVYNIYSDKPTEEKYEKYEDYEDYDDYDYDDEDDEDEDSGKKTSKSGINIFIWVILGLMFIIAAIILYMLVYTPLKSGVNVAEYISQVLNI